MYFQFWGNPTSNYRWPLVHPHSPWFLYTNRLAAQERNLKGLSVNETNTFNEPFLAWKILNERVSGQFVFQCCFVFAANRIFEIRPRPPACLTSGFWKHTWGKECTNSIFRVFRSQGFLPWSCNIKLNNLIFLCAFSITKLKSCFLFQRTELWLSSFEQSNFPS